MDAIERQVMLGMGLTEAQWRRHGCPDGAGAIRTLSARHTGLVALQAPASLGSAGVPMPTRIVMLKWGENESAEGPITVGTKTLAASTLWPGLGFGEVVIDFNHNTVPGHPSYKGEPAKVAATQCALSVEPGTGLVFSGINWTEEGRQNSRHYPDLSPAVKLDVEGEVIFCHSAALCRNGAVNNLHLFSAESVSADLAAKLLTLSAPISGLSGRITEVERRVMEVLGLSELQWLNADRLRAG